MARRFAKRIESIRKNRFARIKSRYFSKVSGIRGRCDSPDLHCAGDTCWFAKHALQQVPPRRFDILAYPSKAEKGDIPVLVTHVSELQSQIASDFKNLFYAPFLIKGLFFGGFSRRKTAP